MRRTTTGGTHPIAQQACVEQIEHDHVAPLGPDVPPALQEGGVALHHGHDLGQAVDGHCPPGDRGNALVDLRRHHTAPRRAMQRTIGQNTTCVLSPFVEGAAARLSAPACAAIIESRPLPAPMSRTWTSPGRTERTEKQQCSSSVTPQVDFAVERRIQR